MLLIMGCAFSRRSSRASRGANKGRRHSASSRAGWGCPRGRGHGDLNQLGVWKRRGRRRGTGKGSEGDSGGFCSRLARWAWPSVPLDGTVGGARSWARPASPLTTGGPMAEPQGCAIGGETVQRPWALHRVGGTVPGWCPAHRRGHAALASLSLAVRGGKAGPGLGVPAPGLAPRSSLLG